MGIGGSYSIGGSAGSSNANLNVGAQQDSFGRLRVSEPYELFSKACEFDAQPLFYENVLTGTATQSYSSNTTSTTLTAAAGGDVAIRQSRWYIRYRPGKSQQIFVTGNFDGQQHRARRQIPESRRPTGMGTS
jgi:hypothetical protein